MAIDRRSWLRTDLTFPVLIQTPAQRFYSYVARDISSGGIFLESRDPFPENCSIELYFALPDSEHGLAARGKVNHWGLHQRGDKRIAGMGISFTDFDNDGATRLDDCLAQGQN